MCGVSALYTFSMSTNFVTGIPFSKNQQKTFSVEPSLRTLVNPLLNTFFTNCSSISLITMLKKPTTNVYAIICTQHSDIYFHKLAQTWKLGKDQAAFGTVMRMLMYTPAGKMSTVFSFSCVYFFNVVIFSHYKEKKRKKDEYKCIPCTLFVKP